GSDGSSASSFVNRPMTAAKPAQAARIVFMVNRSRWLAARGRSGDNPAFQAGLFMVPREIATLGCSRIRKNSGLKAPQHHVQAGGLRRQSCGNNGSRVVCLLPIDQLVELPGAQRIELE